MVLGELMRRMFVKVERPRRDFISHLKELSASPHGSNAIYHGPSISSTSMDSTTFHARRPRLTKLAGGFVHHNKHGAIPAPAFVWPPLCRHPAAVSISPYHFLGSTTQNSTLPRSLQALESHRMSALRFKKPCMRHIRQLTAYPSFDIHVY